MKRVNPNDARMATFEELKEVFPIVDITEPNQQKAGGPILFVNKTCDKVMVMNGYCQRWPKRYL